MPLFNFDLDEGMKADFKICARIDERDMGSQLRVMIQTEIKRKVKDYPEKFKKKPDSSGK